MKVALIHYHLRTGGVTQVLKEQSAALSDAQIEHLILSADEAPDLPSASVPALDYSSEASLTAAELYQNLLAACQDAFGSPPDLWHIHNPTLGKNILFPELIRLIAESQTPLILQTHDFAEDNRPANYPLLVGEQIYPLAPQIHYTLINSRDQNMLEAAGLPAQQSHLLPNAVRTNQPLLPAQANSSRTVLYPVRGIRRKNLGEVLLLAALAPADTRFIISLAPENPQWLATYLRWQEFATEHHLPVLFDVIGKLAPAPGEPHTYQSWQRHATHLLTTSIAEGFGLTFLEPAALGKPLLGRDLPGITRDFHHHGIQPGRLYSSIPIPLKKLNLTKFHTQLSSQLSENYKLYQKPFTSDLAEEAWQELTANEAIDFGNLPESFQEEIIIQAIQSPTSFPLHDWLVQTLAEITPTASPDQLSHYSPKKAQVRLLTLYQNAREAPREKPTWLAKEKVLHQYLSPTRFHFLRS